MVLSRRVMVLVAMVVAAVGIVGVLAAVGSASSKNDGHNNDDKGRTLTVLTKIREAEFLDLKPQGASQGDIRVVNAPLYDASGTNRIGRFDLFCAVTDPADEPDERGHMAECTKTFTLPGGR